jgi:hypothetical protein
MASWEIPELWLEVCRMGHHRTKLVEFPAGPVWLPSIVFFITWWGLDHLTWGYDVEIMGYHWHKSNESLLGDLIYLFLLEVGWSTRQWRTYVSGGDATIRWLSGVKSSPTCFFLNGCHINWPPFSVEKPGVFSWRSQWSNGGRRYPAKICSRAPGFKVERCEDIAGPHSTDHRGICGWKMMELVGTAGETIPEILRGPWRSVGLASSWLEWLSQYFPDPPGSRNSRDSRWVHHFKQQFLKVCLSIDFMISIIRLVFMVLNHCYFSIGPLSNFWYPVTPVTWPTSFFFEVCSDCSDLTWHDWSAPGR